MAANVASNIPEFSTPFVDSSGRITQAWFMLLVQLWRRTGSGSGTTTPTDGSEDDFSDILSPIPAGNGGQSALAAEAVAQFVAMVQPAIREMIAQEMTMARGDAPAQNAPLSNEVTMGQF